MLGKSLRKRAPSNPRREKNVAAAVLFGCLQINTSTLTVRRLIEAWKAIGALNARPSVGSAPTKIDWDMPDASLSPC